MPPASSSSSTAIRTAPVASAALTSLEERMPALLQRSGLGGAAAGVTGDTTIASELTEDTWSAFERVAPAALVVLLLLLWLLLRSRTAPLYLVGVSVLVVAAALGLTVYVFQDLLGYGQLAFFVPVASAILLLALGADYNVFLVSRIWREADERRSCGHAIRVAGSRRRAAITVAGLILAFSFAAVALIPIQTFREIAFALFVGLLLDTLDREDPADPGPGQPARARRWASSPQPSVTRTAFDSTLAFSPARHG